MFAVRAEPKKNLLVMTFSQHVGLGELQRGQADTDATLAALSPGFRLLSDLTGLESMDPACLTYLRTTMDRLNQRGVTEVIRVIPDPHKDIGLSILSLFHYRRGIRIVTCQTMSEAMAALAVRPPA